MATIELGSQVLADRRARPWLQGEAHQHPLGDRQQHADLLHIDGAVAVDIRSTACSPPVQHQRHQIDDVHDPTQVEVAQAIAFNSAPVFDQMIEVLIIDLTVAGDVGEDDLFPRHVTGNRD